MSIVATNITKLYGSQKALDDVSFEIKAGEVVGLLGPNGAGKSTMMKIITCFIPSTSGEVTVEGFDVLEHSLEVKKKIGYLPENNPLYLDMYVKEYLSFVGGIFKLGNSKKGRIAEMLELTGLREEQNKKIGALSKGYRQRVGLAQALLHDPEVLIMDEPTSGLDPNQLLEIRDLIKTVGKEKTVLLSTHIMQEVEAICDRAIIIDEGRIVADDFTANLSRSISDKESIMVEFSEEVTEEMLNTIPGITKIKKLKDKFWIMETGKEKDIRQDVFQFAVKNNISVLSMNKESKNLEEIFQALTKK